MSDTSSRSRFANEFQISRLVKIWLITGLLMIFIQIVIGGITRLTGSGLSITKWDIVTGSVPPLNEAQWTAAFELYQQTPQYHKINLGMSLSDFKFIYFWEYFHRLWARLMFFVFIFPFAWFLWRRMLSKRLMNMLLAVVLLAGLEGFFGWIMVASGLTQRPWVNAYNLTLHLSMGFVIFSVLLWTIFIAYQPAPAAYKNPGLRRFGWLMLGITFLQVALGAMMSGTKAGLFYPSWPDMGGTYLPGLLLDGNNWVGDSFIHYDTNPFMPALIQFLHRNTAYVLSIMVLYFAWKQMKQQISGTFRKANLALTGTLFLQVLLGIFTLINCKAKIPVDLGVAHQAGAVLLLACMLFVNYQMKNREFS